jgi:hypothetical protein
MAIWLRKWARDLLQADDETSDRFQRSCLEVICICLRVDYHFNEIKECDIALREAYNE